MQSGVQTGPVAIVVMFFYFTLQTSPCHTIIPHYNIFLNITTNVAMRLLLLLGAATRILLLLISAWQDAYLDVKFTDIDYHVYSDAAKHVLQGGSPYDRPTYRYSPIVAWLLIPNHLLFEAWGKVLFCTADIVVAFLVIKYYKVLVLLCTVTHIIAGPTAHVAPSTALCGPSKRMAGSRCCVTVALQPLHCYNQRTRQLRVARGGGDYPHGVDACCRQTPRCWT